MLSSRVAQFVDSSDVHEPEEPASARGLALSRREWGMVGAMWLLIGTAAQVLTWSAADDAWWLHGLWCAVGLAILGVTLLRCFRRGFEVVLMDHRVMFCMAFGLYFLFGASFLSFGPKDDVEMALAYYNVNAVVALRVDAVNAIGFGLATVVSALSHGSWFFRTAANAAKRAANVPESVALAVLLLIGAGASINTALHDFGVLTGVIPGVLRTFAQLLIVGVFLAASNRGAYHRLFRPVAFVVTATLVLVGVLQFNKTAVLTALGALVGGLTMVYRPRVVIGFGTVAIVATYIGMSGFVAYGRAAVGNARSQASLSDRLDFAAAGALRSSDRENDGQSNPWARLCYVTAQGAGLDFFDQGSGDNEFSLIPWLFVPRFLAPDKPIITKVGDDLHEKISGFGGSSTGQGIFTSGYYSGGWVGVVAAAALAGWILARTSAVALAILSTRATLLFPLALFGLYIAFRIDGSFLADYAGAFAFLLYPLLAYSLLQGANWRIRRVDS